ncbi:hypothetical protein DUF988 [Gottschalkia acidurici 9a]|uniref:QueT transporter family protein n=1 Tax=Gottschalkia acidurici (strain ATCC 7906 / DSM 604 / BCRC 14475 / CIP 104303 / KCTC 5404 / NCIMB 10678 / 9a) TaxID=1128398 RepID=K0AYM2_GOTA9|nr:QueT transporter family protein [Gottschalkia acidurici]AFS78354.1 hypothetical protein DUF988 [Gottschalkia acidurici 9a]
MNTKYLTKASIIAAIYVVLVLVEIPLGPITYGPIQIRISEGLALLPLVEAAAIPGVFIGCLMANLILAFLSGFGLVDVLGGSLVTLLAAYMTSKMPNKILGVLPPVILNGLIVSIWVSNFMGVPYIVTVGTIGLGELIAVSVFGNITLYIYNRIRKHI